MAENLLIAAKDLGFLALPKACERDFWIKTHFKGRFPFNIPIPHIFTTLDRSTKLAVTTYFDDHGKPPPWLAHLGDFNGYVEPPGYAAFNAKLTDNVTIRGEADVILKRRDGKLIIGDFKTAAYKGIDDDLLPVYTAQLNGYAWIAKKLGMGEVAALVLIYMEPACGEASARLAANRREDGFAQGFRCRTMDISLDPQGLVRLGQRAWTIHSKSMAPEGREGCRDCAATQQLIELNKKIVTSRATFAANFGA